MYWWILDLWRLDKIIPAVISTGERPRTEDRVWRHRCGHGMGHGKITQGLKTPLHAFTLFTSLWLINQNHSKSLHAQFHHAKSQSITHFLDMLSVKLWMNWHELCIMASSWRPCHQAMGTEAIRLNMLARGRPAGTTQLMKGGMMRTRDSRATLSWGQKVGTSLKKLSFSPDFSSGAKDLVGNTGIATHAPSSSRHFCRFRTTCAEIQNLRLVDCRGDFEETFVSSFATDV